MINLPFESGYQFREIFEIKIKPPSVYTIYVYYLYINRLQRTHSTYNKNNIRQITYCHY